MNKVSVLEILLREREKLATSVSEQLVKDVFGIEERVQFDEERTEAPQKINKIVQAALDKEFTGRSGDDDAPH